MEKLSPLKAIKLFCMRCQGIESGKTHDIVRKCKSKWGATKDKLDSFNFPDGCPLWPYRMGTGARKLSEEHKAAVTKNLVKARKGKTNV